MTTTGECVKCGGITVVTSILDELPTHWKPKMNVPPGSSGYVHNELSVTVTIYPPGDNKSPERDTYAAHVEWPNHLPHHRMWITPETERLNEKDAKAWLFEVLSGVDERYVTGEISSLGTSFGGEVESTTRKMPVISDDSLYCDFCEAYLPHYHGDSPSSWYKYHAKYMSDGDHPLSDSTGQSGMQFEFDGSCPHCGESPISEQDLIAHLQGHGYSQSGAFNIMNRVW